MAAFPGYLPFSLEILLMSADFLRRNALFFFPLLRGIPFKSMISRFGFRIFPFPFLPCCAPGSPPERYNSFPSFKVSPFSPIYSGVAGASPRRPKLTERTLSAASPYPPFAFKVLPLSDMDRSRRPVFFFFFFFFFLTLPLIELRLP